MGKCVPQQRTPQPLALWADCVTTFSMTPKGRHARVRFGMMVGMQDEINWPPSHPPKY